MPGEPPGPTGKGGHKPHIDSGTKSPQQNVPPVPLTGAWKTTVRLAPVLVGMSKKLPGYDALGNPAEDIQNKGGPVPAEASNFVKRQPMYTWDDEELRLWMSRLMNRVSWGAMNDVAMEMTKRFLKGHASTYPGTPLKMWHGGVAQGWFSQVYGTYKNKKMDDKVQENMAMRKFHFSFLTDLRRRLRECNYDIDKMGLIEMASDSLAFTSFWDKVLGLAVAVNQVWAVKAVVENYTTDGYDWSGIVKYTLYDHFGLDWHDIVKTIDWTIPLGYPDSGIAFLAWYVLQHFRDAKAFITEITVRYAVEQKLSQTRYVFA